MTPSEMRDEMKWAAGLLKQIEPGPVKKRGKKKVSTSSSAQPIDYAELSFQEQLDLEADEQMARDFARKMIDAGIEATDKSPRSGPACWSKEVETDDHEVGDLASELGRAFKIIDRMIWFLREFDTEGITLPHPIEKESMLLYNECKRFVDDMEYNNPVVLVQEIQKLEETR